MRLREMFVALAISPCLLEAQSGTQVDLHSQARRVDFTGADATRPVKLGTILPTVCTAGDLFFKADAVPGSNLFGCGSGNTWTVQGNANLLFESDVTLVGSRAAASLSPGNGIIHTLVDNGTSITVQHSVDSAVIETRAGQQAGVTLLCHSAGGSGVAFSCTMSPVLMSYTVGMMVHWQPDVDGAAGATLNIDGIGAKAVKLWDGSVPMVGDIVAGVLYDVWYDGVAFRMKNGPGVVVNAVQPVCGAALRGRVWVTAGSAGVKDAVGVCAKDGLDTYAWRPIY